MKSSHIKGKGQRPQQANKQIDGKGKTDDPYFNYCMTILIGCPAEVTTTDGERYEGIYVAFSPEMEILLEAAHLVTDNKDDSTIEKHFDALVIKSEKILSMKCINTDLSYPTREFATDTAISGSRGGGSRDKELTPWECTDDTPDDLTLDGGGSSGKSNGWEAKDMFKKNEEKYGVVSTFNQDLSGYTTQVDKNDTEYKKMEEQAGRVAGEIEGGTVSWERTQAENGDEEEAFSAVVRPTRNNASNSTVNNNNNNNTSSADKYIPPSRRQPNIQQSAPPPSQPHPPSNNNGPSHNANNNSSGMPNRKPMYNQNQNPRIYGAPQNTVYHQDRRNFDRSRAPPPNQYGNNSMHGDVRRAPPGNEDSGPRSQRMNKQVPVDNGRKDMKQLKEFRDNFRLQVSETPPQQQQQQQQQQQMRRPNQQGNTPPQQVGGPPPHVLASNQAPLRNPSPPSSTQTPISSNKSKKEETHTSLPPLIPPNNATTEPANPPPTAAGPHSTPNSAANTTAVPPSSSAAPSASASPTTPSVANISVNESTPTSTSSMTSPSSDNQTPTATGDSKSGDDSKKKFTFNPSAKEFTPKFASRSPSTPPRPPSTPASAATPQVLAAQTIHPGYIPLQMQPIMYAPAAQSYAAQAAALTPSSNSSTSSGVTTPRHGNHNRKGGVVGLPPRSEMTPPQMQMPPPILAPATAIQQAPHQQPYFLSQQPYQTVMLRLPPPVQVYQTEGSGGTQIHPAQMHYLPPHNGATPPNNTGHQQNSSAPTNPNAPTNVVPANGHGYGQTTNSHSGSHHMGYQQLVSVVPYPYPPNMQPNLIQVPYLQHQGGTPTVIPQSQ